MIEAPWYESAGAKCARVRLLYDDNIISVICDRIIITLEMNHNQTSRGAKSKK